MSLIFVTQTKTNEMHFRTCVIETTSVRNISGHGTRINTICIAQVYYVLKYIVVVYVTYLVFMS